MLASFLQFCSEMFLKLPTVFVGWHCKHWHLDCGEVKKNTFSLSQVFKSQISPSDGYFSKQHIEKWLKLDLVFGVS